MINYLICFLFIISIQDLFAKSKTESVSLSPTFKIEIPFDVLTKAEFSSLKTKYFKLKSGEITHDLYFIYAKPSTLGNKFSVNRYWNDSRKQVSYSDRNEKDFGCVKTESRSYKCSRNVGQNGKFVSESLFWNAKNDLVLVRVTSLDSFGQNRKVLDSLKVHQISRLPAGSEK